MAAKVATHYLAVHVEDGHFQVRVICPDEPLGAERPCAVWDDDDGSKRRNECTFEQYADDCELEDWLHGTWSFPLAHIVEAGSGDDWHAEFKEIR